MQSKKLAIASVVRGATYVILGCAFMTLGLFSRGGGLYDAFHNPWWWGLCAAASTVFLATATSLLRRTVYALSALFCLVLLSNQLTYFRPLQQPVPGTQFVDMALPDVLHAIAKQRQVKPYRKFAIFDEQTFNKRITIEIPDHCTLGQALEIIANATDTHFDWHWWSWCGNTYPPTTANVHFYTAGTPKPSVPLYEIDRYGIRMRGSQEYLPGA